MQQLLDLVFLARFFHFSCTDNGTADSFHLCHKFHTQDALSAEFFGSTKNSPAVNFDAIWQPR